MSPQFPLNLKQVQELAAEHPTPFYLYDELRIHDNALNLKDDMAQAGFRDFRNFFAVKATPNPAIMRILADAGQGMDASSLAELELCRRVGVDGPDIMFSSNNTTDEEFIAAFEQGAIINFDDITHVRRVLGMHYVPKAGCCRYNPGDLDLEGGDEWIIGKPSEAKYGMTKVQIMEAYRLMKEAGVERFGIHTMAVSNDLDWRSHLRIAEELFGLVKELAETLGIRFEFINLGGGIGVPYRPDEAAFDTREYARQLKSLYDDKGMVACGLPAIWMENGRYMTADAGYLVTRIVNRKETYRTYLGVDASMSNLMRPSMYGAYHHMTVLGKPDDWPKETVDVTGSLCENNDKFAIQRGLPVGEIGDYLVIHTTGAHGHAMGFQYNGKLRSAELLLRSDGSIELIRRAENLDDYFTTLNLKKEK